MPEIHIFPPEKIQTLIKNLRDIPNPHDYETEGWIKSKADPSFLLKGIESLKLKEGYVLRAYTFRSGDNGNGVVWAMPESGDFPDPQDCIPDEETALKSPIPFGALGPIEVLEGDGTPWSYFCASMLIRELWEFGALWHGTTWGACSVITGKDPWDEKPLKYTADGSISSKKEEWEWYTKPRDFSPTVAIERTKIKVKFSYYDPVVSEGLYRMTDTYQSGKFNFKSRWILLAQGPGGIIF